VEQRRAIRARLLAHRIDAAKTFGHQQASLDTLAFKERVGADRGAVTEVGDVGGLHALRYECFDARQYRARGVVGRRGHLGDRDLAGRFIDINEIREGSAGVDCDAVASHPWRLSTSLSFVMPALVAGIHVLLSGSKSWMAGTLARLRASSTRYARP